MFMWSVIKYIWVPICLFSAKLIHLSIKSRLIEKWKPIDTLKINIENVNAYTTDLFSQAGLFISPDIDIFSLNQYVSFMQTYITSQFSCGGVLFLEWELITFNHYLLLLANLHLMVHENKVNFPENVINITNMLYPHLLTELKNENMQANLYSAFEWNAWFNDRYNNPFLNNSDIKTILGDADGYNNYVNKNNNLPSVPKFLRFDYTNFLLVVAATAYLVNVSIKITEFM